MQRSSRLSLQARSWLSCERPLLSYSNSFMFCHWRSSPLMKKLQRYLLATLHLTAFLTALWPTAAVQCTSSMWPGRNVRHVASVGTVRWLASVRPPFWPSTFQHLPNVHMLCAFVCQDQPFMGRIACLYMNGSYTHAWKGSQPFSARSCLTSFGMHLHGNSKC